MWLNVARGFAIGFSLVAVLLQSVPNALVGIAFTLIYLGALYEHRPKGGVDYGTQRKG